MGAFPAALVTFVDDRGRPVVLEPARDSGAANAQATAPPMTPREAQQASVQRGLTGCAAVVLVPLMLVMGYWGFRQWASGGYRLNGLVSDAGSVGGILLTFALVRWRRSRTQPRLAMRASHWLAAWELRQGRCAACGYGLEQIEAASDGCRVCPECGAAWDLPMWARDWAVLGQAERSDASRSRRRGVPANATRVAEVGSVPFMRDVNPQAVHGAGLLAFLARAEFLVLLPMAVGGILSVMLAEPGEGWQAAARASFWVAASTPFLCLAPSVLSDHRNRILQSERMIDQGACPCCETPLRRAQHGRTWAVCDACGCVCWMGDLADGASA